MWKILLKFVYASEKIVSKSIAFFFFVCIFSKFDFKTERSEYERLWNMFSACLEVFEGHMRKSLELVKSFPIHAGKLREQEII